MLNRRKRKTSKAPITVRAECTKYSSGSPTKASAKGRMKPRIICPTTGTFCTQPRSAAAWATTEPTEPPRSRLNARSARMIWSRITASPTSTPARISRIVKNTQVRLRRILSFIALMPGNRCVMRRVSSRNRPIADSIRMITSAAMCETSRLPTRYSPAPTIADIGRWISQKLTKAPPSAITSTKPAMKNWLDADAVSECSTFSDDFWISWYLSMRVSMRAAPSCMPVILASTLASVCSRDRQNGMKPARILWRCS